MSPQFEIQMTAVLTAAACALPGVFLVLRGLSMLSDSITHTILLGIVVSFFITRDLSSPLLFAGAALVGVVTVWLTETLSRTRLFAKDAAIGIVFPFFFSVAVLLVTRYAGSVHLDTDSVLLGELAFVPFDRITLMGMDIGAKAIYVSAALFLMNLTAIFVFFKELKITAFDPAFAGVLGFAPALLHYGTATLVSLTAVGAFQTAGSVLVVAFMIGPPATAYLLTDDLKKMLAFSGFIGAASGILGYQAAALLDISIAGSMAVAIGIIFFLALLFAPHRGLASVLYRRREQKTQFAKAMLLLHLSSCGDGMDAKTAAEHMRTKLCWSRAFTEKILLLLLRENTVARIGSIFRPTEPKGARAVCASMDCASFQHWDFL